MKASTDRARQWLFAALYLMAWAGFGVWALPLFERMIEGITFPQLPALTILLLRLGPVGCLKVGLVGAVFIITANDLVRSGVLRRSLLLALCLPLIGAVAVLLWPLRSL